MTYQSTWRKVCAGAKLGLGAAVVAGVMAFSGSAQAVVYTNNIVDGAFTDSYTVPNPFQVPDIFRGTRDWEADSMGLVSLDGQAIEITYFFNVTPDDAPTLTTTTTLNPNPGVQGPKGIANFELAWYDSDGTSLFGLITSETFTDGFGKLDDTLVLTASLVGGAWYALQATGTLLADGGWYNVRVEAIPLPAGLILFLSGLAGIGFLGRYKAKRREPAVA